MLTISTNRDKFRTIHDVRDLASCKLPTREDIGAELKPGVRGNWQPIPHYDLATAVYESLSRRGLDFEVPDLVVSKDDYSMILGITLPGYLDTPDLVPGLFVKHSNDQSQALMIGVGGEVFVCSNGMITASWTVRTKHREDLDLPRFIDESVGDGLQALGGQSRRVESLKGRSMPNPGSALLDLVRTNHLPQRAAHKAWDEWKDPHYDYEAHVEDSRWNWYNSVTVAAKELPVSRQTPLLQRAFEVAETN
jgi:hypothetical protein